MTQARVKIIPIEDCSWDCSMKGNFQVPINYSHLTMIKCVKVDALYLLMYKRLDKRYVLNCKAESLQDLC